MAGEGFLIDCDSLTCSLANAIPLPLLLIYLFSCFSLSWSGKRVMFITVDVCLKNLLLNKAKLTNNLLVFYLSFNTLFGKASSK